VVVVVAVAAVVVEGGASDSHLHCFLVENIYSRIPMHINVINVSFGVNSSRVAVSFDALPIYVSTEFHIASMHTVSLLCLPNKPRPMAHTPVVLLNSNELPARTAVKNPKTPPLLPASPSKHANGSIQPDKLLCLPKNGMFDGHMPHLLKLRPSIPRLCHDVPLLHLTLPPVEVHINKTGKFRRRQRRVETCHEEVMRGEIRQMEEALEVLKASFPKHVTDNNRPKDVPRERIPLVHAILQELDAKRDAENVPVVEAHSTQATVELVALLKHKVQWKRRLQLNHA
jgi:hypothetical protein